MSTTFQYNLIKEFKPYNKYISQLTKPVLRVLIQGKISFEKCFSCIFINYNFRMSNSMRSLYRE